MSTEKFYTEGRFVDNVSEEFSLSPTNPKMEIALRKERQQLEEEAQYTYKPTLNKAKKGHEKDKPDENRFDRLYSDALKRHLESKWKESVDDKDLTFKPKISAKGSNSRSSSRERGTMDNAIRIQTPKKVVEVKEFSFKPTITKRAQSIDRSQHRETPERLYLHSKVAKEKQEKLKLDFDQKNMEDCTFTPKTNMAAKSTPQKLDLTERMDKYEEFKNRRREEALRVKNEQEIQGVTFKPVIKLTKRSSTPTKTSVYERLSSVDREREISASYAEVEAQMTFKPQLISKRSASPGPKSASGGDYKDVHERLFQEGLQRKKDMEAERQLIMEENESHLTFKPVINPRSLHKGDGAHGGDKEGGPVFERLATTSSRQYMQEVLSKIKTDLEMKDCTFKPKLLTESSRSHPKDGGAEPIFVRLTQEGERVKADTQRKQELKISEELSHATFSPQIPMRSSSIAKRRSSVATSVDGVMVEDNIYLRLHATPKTPVAVGIDPTVSITGSLSASEQKEKVVLPKQDLDKVFRRLSMATTESLGSLTQRDDDVFVGANKAPSVATSSLVLPEKTVEKIFTNLSMKRTASFSMRMLQVQEDAAPTKSPIKGIKTLPEENLANMFQRLSQPTGSSVDLNETLLAEGRRGSVRPSDTSPMTRTLSSSRLMSPTVASGAKYLSTHGSSSQLTTHLEAPLPVPVYVSPKPNVKTAAAPSTMPPAPPSVTATTPVQAPAVKSVKSNGGKAAAPAAVGGDFFSKLEASLSLMESMKFDSPTPAAPVAQAPAIVAPPEVLLVETQDAKEVAVDKPEHQQSQTVVSERKNSAPVERGSPCNGSNGGRGGRGTKKAPPTQQQAPTNGGPKVLKGKKKSSEVMAENEQQRQLDLQEQQLTADEFIQNIPFITTEGSDSEEDEEA